MDLVEHEVKKEREWIVKQVKDIKETFDKDFSTFSQNRGLGSVLELLEDNEDGDGWTWKIAKKVRICNRCGQNIHTGHKYAKGGSRVGFSTACKNCGKKSEALEEEDNQN
jgi:hypothetical protein